VADGVLRRSWVSCSAMSGSMRDSPPLHGESVSADFRGVVLSFIQTDMGQKGADFLGIEKAPVPVKAAVDGILKLVSLLPSIQCAAGEFRVCWYLSLTRVADNPPGRQGHAHVRGGRTWVYQVDRGEGPFLGISAGGCTQGSGFTDIYCPAACVDSGLMEAGFFLTYGARSRCGLWIGPSPARVRVWEWRIRHHQDSDSLRSSLGISITRISNLLDFQSCDSCPDSD
jgi:hypothetical protein